MADPTVAHHDRDKRKQILAVLNFLRKSGFKDAESAFKKEAKLEEEGRSLDADEVDMSQTLAAYKSSNDPSMYDEYYSNLKIFIEKCLDVHRCELTAILYPIFVHMYLELVYNGHEQIAKDFYTKYSADQEYYYEKDIKQLATVTKPEHMRGNQLLENFKSNKFNICMSRDSMNQIKRYLIEKRVKALHTILQEHMLIDVFDGHPRSKEVINAKCGSLVGEARTEANRQKVFYGLPNKPELAVLQEDEEEDEKDKDGDKPKKKKSRKDPASMKKMKNDPNAPAAARIPIPELKDSDKFERMKVARETRRCVKVGPDQKASVCFYTFFNSCDRVTCARICDDGSLLALGLADSTLQVWSLTQQPLRLLKPTTDLDDIDKEASDVLERMMDDRSAADFKTLHGHSGPVYGASFSPDRTLLVTSSEDGTVRLWSLYTWSNLVVYKGHNYPVWDVQFSPLGYYFASCGFDRTARFWSTDHTQPLRLLVGHLADIDCLEFHPNANYVATGSSDRTVRMYDVSQGQCVRVFTGSKDSILALSISPCGRYIAGVGADKLVHVWSIPTGDLMAQLSGHTDTLYSAAWSRDSAVLATGGLDFQLRVWDMALIASKHSADSVVSSETEPSCLIDSFATKSTAVLCVHFTHRNLLLAAGPYTGAP